MVKQQLRRIDHVTCAVRPDTIRQWAWFYIDVLGGTLTLRTDDTNPGGPSSMMVWTIDFAEFGVALIAGIDREEKSHVTAFVEKHGDHCFQHVAFQVPNLEALSARLATFGVSFLGDTLARKDATGRYVKQVFGSPFHDEENSALVGFYEFVERPSAEEVEGEGGAPEISFSARAGTLLYDQAQRAMELDRRARLTRFSRMPPGWEVPDPQPDRAHDTDAIGEIQRWHSYRSANARFPRAREREIAEMVRQVGAREGETIAEVGSGHGALTFALAAEVGASGRVYTYDVSRDNLVAVMLANERGSPIVPVAIEARPEGPRFPNPGLVDAVATIATFHHFDDRSAATGVRGRTAAIAAFHRLLRPGGRLVIGDVGAGTAPARYFDAIDDPRYCSPNGHPHDFFTGEELAAICVEAGFVDVRHEVRCVPWAFASADEAVEFLAVMHNAQCPLDEVREITMRHLRTTPSGEGVLLEWELLFLEARRP